MRPNLYPIHNLNPEHAHRTPLHSAGISFPSRDVMQAATSCSTRREPVKLQRAKVDPGAVQNTTMIRRAGQLDSIGNFLVSILFYKNIDRELEVPRP